MIPYLRTIHIQWDKCHDIPRNKRPQEILLYMYASSESVESYTRIMVIWMARRIGTPGLWIFFGDPGFLPMLLARNLGIIWRLPSPKICRHVTIHSALMPISHMWCSCIPTHMDSCQSSMLCTVLMYIIPVYATLKYMLHIFTHFGCND